MSNPTVRAAVRAAAVSVFTLGLWAAAASPADAAQPLRGHAPRAAAESGPKAALVTSHVYCGMINVAGTEIRVNTYLTGNQVRVTVDATGATTTVRSSSFTASPTHHVAHLPRAHHLEWTSKIDPSGGVAHVVGAIQPERIRWAETCPVG